MSRHVLDTDRGGTGHGRLRQFLRIERKPAGPWSLAARTLWHRRQRDPLGRTLPQFAAITRGRSV